MPTSTVVANGYYRIRQAGAKSQIANLISNGKKCHYVQIGSEQTAFGSLEEAMEFVEGKGLEADAMSMDFGIKPAEPEVETAEPEVETAEPEDEAVAVEADAESEE